jgi:hypothetical protein
LREKRQYFCQIFRRKYLKNRPQEWNRDKKWRDVEDVLRAAAADRDSDEIIAKCLEFIVAPKSVTQAAKGVVTAGPWKSARYAGAKLNKMFLSYGRQLKDPVDTSKFKI